MEEPVYPSTRSIILALVVTFAVLAVYATLKLLEMPAGDLIDWGIGIAGFWWLLGVVTIPWNVYFGARAVRTEVLESQKREIDVGAEDLAYVDETSRRALGVAVALHGLTALGFGALAWFGLTPVGWFGAAAALCLTFFRPAVRLYRHVVSTLTRISARAHHPREDIVTLRRRVQTQLHRIEDIERDLRRDDENSWAHEIVDRTTRLESSIEELRARHAALVRENADEHQRLAREAKRAAEQVAEDTEFLGNVREIIRFVKQA